MWIQRLDVTDCAGIAAAGVVLQPGLNVLHGPNELGKSSLVQAIRAALLLPATSSAAERLRAWNVDAPPTVTLTFEEAAQRIWRVRKSFGRSGQAYLEFSRDGRTFSQEGRGREVDGALQDVLRWGIEPPGGRSGRRGMPASFITTALLGEQSAIDAILATSLADDPNASGRDRLTEALQAMAEDPRCKQVLAAVQARVDEAFTATGRRRGGRGSPWSRLREDRVAAERRARDVRQQVEESEAARARAHRLQQEVLAAEAEAERAARERTTAGIAQRRRAAREAAAQALAEAQERLRQAQAQVRMRDERTAAAAAAEEEAAALRESLAAAERVVAEVAPRAAAARERVRQLETGDAEQGRRLREQEAENRRLKLQQQAAELAARGERAQKLAALEDAVAGADAEIRERGQALEERRALLRAAQAKTVADNDRLDGLELERACARYRSAVENSRTLAAELEAARRLAGEAGELADRANGKRTQAAALGAPAAAEIEHLKGLDAERRVAQARLAVGLAMDFTPENAGSAELIVDGVAQRRRFQAGERLACDAERELRLAIDGVGAFRVRGGGRDRRQDAETADERWRTAAAAVFARAGVDTVAGLEEKRRQAAELLDEAQALDGEAQEKRVRSEGLDELERRAVVAGAEAEQRRSAVAGWFAADVSVDDHVRSLGALRGEDVLAEEIEELRDEVRERESLCGRMAHQVQVDEEQLAGARRDLENRRDELRGFAPAAEDRSARPGALDAERRRIDRELTAVDAEIAAVRSAATAEAEEARRASAGLAEQETAARMARGEAAQRLQGAEKHLARLQGEVDTLRQAVDRLDVAALQAACDERQGRFDALPDADDDGPADLAALESAADRAAGHAASLRRELSREEGALEQVGGQYVEEQAAQAREALEALARREHDVEVEYGAWRLLREKLAEAEKEDVANLGDALVKPVSAHMSELTGGRYGEVRIGPQLDAAGVLLGGDERSFDDVSVGAREQIALLLRIAVAEALGSFVILDDQLTQSDPRRMAWIRRLLGDAARKIQVVVTTCHPDAYLTGGEHAVNLEQCVRRHDVGPPSAAGGAGGGSGPEAPVGETAPAPPARRPAGRPDGGDAPRPAGPAAGAMRRRREAAPDTEDLEAALRASLRRSRE